MSRPLSAYIHSHSYRQCCFHYLTIQPRKITIKMTPSSPTCFGQSCSRSLYPSLRLGRPLGRDSPSLSRRDGRSDGCTGSDFLALVVVLHDLADLGYALLLASGCL